MKSRTLFGTVACAMLVLATSSAAALGQNDPAAYPLLVGNAEDSPPSISETMADQWPCAGCCDVGGCPSGCCPRWTASADFIILDRIGTVNQTLVTTYPVSPPPVPSQLVVGAGTERLNSDDLNQGFAGGPRVDLIRHGDRGYDLELSYFQIDGWSNARGIGPDDPPDSQVMTSPGFMQTNQRTDQAMVWNYATKLYDAELNVRWNPCCRVTILAGFRWMNLGEHLVGTLNPTTFPWEQSYWHFWNTTTTNNLYGFQIGADGKIWERGRFSIDGLVKAGIFDNNAEQTTEISVMAKQQRSGSASTNAAAFVGETGLQCKYQVTRRLLLRAGYEAIWLQGAALAPDRFKKPRPI